MSHLADHGCGRLRKEGHFLEAGLDRGVLQAAESLCIRRRTIAGIRAGEDHRMPDHDTRRACSDRRVSLVLQSLQHHRDERSHAEVGRPRVGARKTKLRKLVFYSGEQPSVIATAAFAVLAAIRVPTIWGQRTVPAIGLFVTGLEKRPDRLLARRASPTPVQVHKRWESHRRTRRTQCEHLDAAGIGNGDRAVARSEIDAIPDGRFDYWSLRIGLRSARRSKRCQM